MCITYYGASHIATVAHCAIAAVVHVLVLCISRVEKETEQIAGHRYPLCASTTNTGASHIAAIVHCAMAAVEHWH